MTDSFHAAVFSILFHRPFLLVQRGAMNSRFETLLAHAGLQDRLLASVADVGGSLEIDWAPVDERIEAIRDSSLSFLGIVLPQPESDSALSSHTARNTGKLPSLKEQR